MGAYPRPGLSSASYSRSRPLDEVRDADPLQGVCREGVACIGVAASCPGGGSGGYYAG